MEKWWIYLMKLSTESKVGATVFVILFIALLYCLFRIRKEIYWITVHYIKRKHFKKMTKWH